MYPVYLNTAEYQDEKEQNVLSLCTEAEKFMLKCLKKHKRRKAGKDYALEAVYICPVVVYGFDEAPDYVQSAELKRSI